MALTTPTTARSDPARARGLRRSRDLTVAMPGVDPTALPAPIEPVHVLALVIRERQARCVAGKLQSARAHPRPFKALIAELGYLRRLAAAGDHGGTVLTSMGQLVHGFAKFNVAWDTTGDWYEVRDHYQSSVRAHLRLLATLGLIRVRVGVDLDGEERRTELVLLDAPAVSVDELQQAAQTLEGWTGRLGAELNSRARKRAIVNAVSHSRPLTASEIQRRGCLQTRQRATRQADREISRDVSAPPSGTSAPLRKNNSGGTSNLSDQLNASYRTGVHTREHAHGQASANAALEPIRETETAGIERGAQLSEPPVRSQGAPGGPSELASGAEWDPEAIVARVKARQAQRAPVLARIAQQARTRAAETAQWSLERQWSAVRLREAWVVARWGAGVAADAGPSNAGPLSEEHYLRLRRAVARYERNATAAPEGWPTGGLAALLHLGALSALGQWHDSPRLLCYAIGRLDQISRRMRALASADSATHYSRAERRAHRRREATPKPARPTMLQFRIGSGGETRWPPLLLLDGHHEPVFSKHGELLLNPRLIDAGLAANPSLTLRLAIRDAYLLAGRRPPTDVDGRVVMAARHRGQLDRPDRRPAFSLQDAELHELAHLTQTPIATLRRLSPAYRAGWLQAQRVAAAQRTAADAAQFKAQLTDASSGWRSPLAEPDDEIARINAQLRARREGGRP